MALAEDLDVDPLTRRVNSRESPRREFKLAFDAASLARYAKTMAAFANADGGAIVFGVRDRPRLLEGCDPLAVPDENEITTKLQNWFEPSPRFEIVEDLVAGRQVVAVRVDASQVKPVICKATVCGKRKPSKPGAPAADEEVLREGDIYFRYGGKTDRIRFADLARIFEERDKRTYRALMEAISAVQRIGAERIGVVDATAVTASGGVTKMYVPKEAVPSLRLIDRGRFVETAEDGDRAYVVVGQVEIGLAETVAVEDNDRLRPAEVVGLLRGEATTALHPGAKLTGSHLAAFAKARRLRGGGAGGKPDGRYCKFDDKAALWFYRRAFVDLVRAAMRDDPVRAARDLGLSAKVQAQIAASRAPSAPLLPAAESHCTPSVPA